MNRDYKYVEKCVNGFKLLGYEIVYCRKEDVHEGMLSI